jgi:hypothetical protein
MNNIAANDQNLNQLLLDSYENSDEKSNQSSNEKKRCCDSIQTALFRRCSPLVTNRLLGFSCAALTIPAIYLKTQYLYTEGDYDISTKKFTQGHYISGTALSATIGTLGIASVHFFAQSSWSRLALHQLDVLLLFTLTMLFFILNEAELNDIRDDYTIKDNSVYEWEYAWIFGSGAAAITTALFHIFRKPQIDDRYNLKEKPSSLANIALDEFKDNSKATNHKIKLEKLLHPKHNQEEVHYLLCMQKSIKTYKIWTGISFGVGIGCITTSILSKHIEKMNLFQQEIAGQNGQYFLLMEAGLFFTANAIAKLSEYLLFRSIKKHQKNVISGSVQNPNPLSYRVKVFTRVLYGETSGLLWAFLFNFGLNNIPIRLFTYYFFNLKGIYEENQMAAGFDSIASKAPEADQAIKELCKLIPPRRKIICCSLQIPRNKREWKGFYFRNFDNIVRVAGGVSVAATTTWYLINVGVAETDGSSKVKVVSACVASGATPAWYGLKVWVDLTYKGDKSGRFKRTVKYYITNHVSPIILSGYLINQIYGSINSHRENSQATGWDYTWNIAAQALLTAPLALSAATIGEIPSLLITMLYLLGKKTKLGEYNG